jgi:hypothetical protein
MIPKRIIFIVESTFNKRDFKRFGVEILMGRGFCVEIWDFTPFLNSNYYRNYTVPDQINFSSHRTFNTKKKAFNALFELDSKKDNVITVFNTNRKTVFVFNYLKKNEINFGLLVLGAIPSNRLRLPVFQKIKNIISRPKYSIKNIYQRLINFLIKKHIANFIIVGGDADKIKAIQSVNYNETSKLVSAHTFDYDDYLKEKQTTTNLINGEKYAVMLDEYNLYHPDNLLVGISVNPKTYYKDLNKFFTNIEHFFGMPVIIAEHPRSNSEKMKNSYGGRKRVFGKTIQLVKNAELVLAHSSTSLNYAVLYNKPVVFLSSSDYSVNYKNSVHSFAKVLSKTPVDVSNPTNILTSFLEINDEAYKRYIDLFIKSPNTPQKFLWEIFADFIDSEESKRNPDFY